MGSLLKSELAKATRGVNAKGALIAGTGADFAIVDQNSAPNGSHIVADSSADTGLSWASLLNGVAAGTGVSVVERGSNAAHRTVFTLAALSIAITDNGAAGGQGSQSIYTFPEGIIQIIGCSYNLTVARVSTGITTTAALVGALGSAAAGAGDATLTGSEADLIASTSGTLTAGAGVLQKYGSLVAAAFDGHTTAMAAFLNIAIPDAGISATDAVLVSGTIQIIWANLGDY